MSDMFYGNKQLSSNFDVAQFARYLNGENTFEPLPPFNEVIVRNRDEISAVLAEPRRRHYLAEGSLSFRGQSREHTVRRGVPNPRRANPAGLELAVLPGVYRQKDAIYSFSRPAVEVRSCTMLLHELEPNNPDVYSDSQVAHDLMRVEQHYAAGTRGLDLSFDIDSALFFATHRFTQSDSGIATFEPIETGAHDGVIYCFRFTDPPVKATAFHIREFDVFKTLRPERILRQECALPLIGDHERNIAITDIDCVIRLHSEFVTGDAKSPAYMFPSVKEDLFYGKLLDLKKRHRGALPDVVEYEWAWA